MYENIPSSAEKAYLELRDKPHDVATQSDPTQAAAMIAWLKRYFDKRHPLRAVPVPATAAGPRDLRVPSHVPGVTGQAVQLSPARELVLGLLLGCQPGRMVRHLARGAARSRGTGRRRGSRAGR